LGKSHAEKLIEARKPVHTIIAAITFHAMIEPVARQEIEKLSEDHSALVHWPPLSARPGQKNGQMIKAK
jgi:hypothetical protein